MVNLHLSDFKHASQHPRRIELLSRDYESRILEPLNYGSPSRGIEPRFSD